MEDGNVHVVTDNKVSDAALLIQRHFRKLYWAIGRKEYMVFLRTIA
jgi:hypothetical protein